MSTSPANRRAWLQIAVIALGVVLAPLTLRLLNPLVVGAAPPLGYLPALEFRRSHHAFDAGPIAELRYADPQWVFIGDSMLGTRIDPVYLGSLSSTGDRNASFLNQAATGPAWWYLALKNQLIPSGVKPRAVFVFFRDTNLTDTMFRLEGLYGGALDDVALPEEPELNALVAMHRRGAWNQAHLAIGRLYQTDVASSWIEPAVRGWYERRRYPTPEAVDGFRWTLDQTFGIDTLRRDVAADMAVATNLDFARDLPASVLPLMTRLARDHGQTLCFVRVQRRPVNGRPPLQSPELVRYVADLRHWIEASGALFHDDTGDPEMTEDLYNDGDHVGDRRRYTEIFRRRLDPLFR